MFNVFGTRVVVDEGPAAKLGAQALAFPANDHLWMGAGLGGELKQTGGEEIEVEAVRQGPAELGRAIATGGGSLPFDHLYHLVVMGQDLKIQSDPVRTALAAALREAGAAGLQTVAVAPLVSEDQLGALHEVAQQVIAALFEALGGETSLEQVILGVTGGDAGTAYREAFFAAIRGEQS